MPLPLLLALVTSTTVAPPRIVGDPLPSWVVIAAGGALLVAILAGSVFVRRRTGSTSG